MSAQRCTPSRGGWAWGGDASCPIEAASLALWARTVGLPALVVGAQGAILGVVGGSVLGLNLGATLLLAVLLVAIGVSFVLANHALTAWLEDRRAAGWVAAGHGYIDDELPDARG